jgi:CheY-like chemotaxis protein
MRIYSEEGHGTTVKIYLPRFIGAGEVSATPTAKPNDVSSIPRARSGETILVVEDNDRVRDYAKEVLEDLGYSVLEAGDANEALAMLEKTPRVALLFTDVVLPGSTNGRMLADRARQKFPNLPVLYTTGYTRNAIVHQERLDPDVELVNKPTPNKTSPAKSGKCSTQTAEKRRPHVRFGQSLTFTAPIDLVRRAIGGRDSPVAEATRTVRNPQSRR